MTKLVILLLLCFSISLSSAAYFWHPRFLLNPTLTDPNITRDYNGPGFGDHLITWRAETPACVTCRLFVFLSGSRGQARLSTHFQNTMANQGYHVIGLAYQNPMAVEDICVIGSTVDKFRCQLQCRQEAILGQNFTDFINVSYADSIVNRLYKVLLYLDTYNHSLGFGKYLIAGATGADAINWPLVGWTGHSQGGGTSQVIASMYPIYRCVPVAGAISIVFFQQLTYTPAFRYYAFANQADPFFLAFDSAWTSPQFGLDTLNGTVIVEHSSPPYNYSHYLISIQNCTGSDGSANAHGCVSTDAGLNFGPDGYPIYEPTWRYLLGENPVSNTAASPSPSAAATGPSSSPAPNPTTGQGSSPSPNPTPTPSPNPNPSPNPASVPSPNPNPSPNSSPNPSPSPSPNPNPTGASSSPGPSSPPGQTEPSLAPRVSLLLGLVLVLLF